MTQTIHSQDELATPIKSLVTSFGDEAVTTESFSSPKIRPFVMKVKRTSLFLRHSSFSDLAAELEGSEETHQELKDARAWVGREVYGADKDSIKSLRLEKGLSQTQLGNSLKTSQSHIARIESGKIDIAFSTFDKLCEVLEIQPNQLSQILKNKRDA